MVEGMLMGVFVRSSVRSFVRWLVTGGRIAACGCCALSLLSCLCLRCVVFYGILNRETVRQRISWGISPHFGRKVEQIGSSGATVPPELPPPMRWFPADPAAKSQCQSGKFAELQSELARPFRRDCALPDSVLAF